MKTLFVLFALCIASISAHAQEILSVSPSMVHNGGVRRLEFKLINEVAIQGTCPQGFILVENDYLIQASQISINGNTATLDFCLPYHTRDGKYKVAISDEVNTGNIFWYFSRDSILEVTTVDTVALLDSICPRQAHQGDSLYLSIQGKRLELANCFMEPIVPNTLNSCFLRHTTMDYSIPIIEFRELTLNSADAYQIFTKTDPVGVYNLELNISTADGEKSLVLENAFELLSYVSAEESGLRNALRVAPNPANAKSDFVVSLRESGNIKYRIISSEGGLVASGTFQSCHAGDNSFSLSNYNLSSGAYVLEVVLPGETLVEKFVVSE